jgi:hypothetical protein
MIFDGSINQLREHLSAEGQTLEAMYLAMTEDNVAHESVVEPPA